MGGEIREIDTPPPAKIFVVVFFFSFFFQKEILETFLNMYMPSSHPKISGTK